MTAPTPGARFGENELGTERSSDGAGGGSPILWLVIGLAVSAAGYFVLAGDRDSGRLTTGSATGASSEPTRSVPLRDAAPTAGNRPVTMAPGSVDLSEAGARTAADYHGAGESPPVEEIPPGILEEFRRGTAPISEERRELMARGREEMPDRIRKDFESAATRPIPPEVLADFEDPFPDPPANVREHFPGGVIRGEMNGPPSLGTPEPATP